MGILPTAMLSPGTLLRLHYVMLFLFMGGLGNFLPIWLRHNGWTDGQIGLQGAMIFACLCVFPLAWGHLVDHWGRPTKVLRILAIGCLFTFLPFVFTTDVGGLIVATLFFFAFRLGY
jgi:MFS family permease